ncbi:MAG TPA: ABC transporter substrate-binding protein [Chloroflexota bacterium]|nr:ABC transporter substrate-binding protein [Chloroflexota bacterium]
MVAAHWRTSRRQRSTIALAPARGVLVGLGVLLLVACGGPAAAPKPSAPAATSAPAAAATSAPAAQAAASTRPAAPTQPPAPATVQAGLMLSASDTGFYVGIEQGYFAEQGITVEITPIQSAATMLAPLAAGQIDVGGTTLTPGFMNAIARDVRIWAVADKGSTPPGFGYQGLVLRREAWDNGTIRSAADLRGKKVSVPSRGSGAQASLDKALRREGLTTDDVDITPLNFPDMEAGFAGGAIDGAIVIEPFLSSIVDHGVGHLYARNDEYYPNQQVAVVLYSNQFAREQTDVARRFMVGYLKGVRDFNDAWVKGDAAKREAVIAALVKHTPIKDRAVYDRVAMPGLNPNGTINRESLAADQEYFLSTGDQQQRVELSQVVDPQFADYAVQVLGRYE